jgi:hypothetical protein
MTLPQQRKRNIARLCIYCVKHIAFEKSGRRELFIDESWRVVNGNFLDMYVLE